MPPRVRLSSVYNVFSVCVCVMLLLYAGARSLEVTLPTMKGTKGRLSNKSHVYRTPKFTINHQSGDSETLQKTLQKHCRSHHTKKVSR